MRGEDARRRGAKRGTRGSWRRPFPRLRVLRGRGRRRARSRPPPARAFARLLEGARSRGSRRRSRRQLADTSWSSGTSFFTGQARQKTITTSLRYGQVMAVSSVTSSIGQAAAPARRREEPRRRSAASTGQFRSSGKRARRNGSAAVWRERGRFQQLRSRGGALDLVIRSTIQERTVCDAQGWRSTSTPWLKLDITPLGLTASSPSRLAQPVFLDLVVEGRPGRSPGPGPPGSRCRRICASTAADVPALDLLQRGQRPAAGRPAGTDRHEPQVGQLDRSCPVHTTAPRSSTFRSSRMFPGQPCAMSAAIASAETPSSGCFISAESRSRKCSTSSGMSSRRSRSGGSVMGMTLSR